MLCWFRYGRLACVYFCMWVLVLVVRFDLGVLVGVLVLVDTFLIGAFGVDFFHFLLCVGACVVVLGCGVLVLVLFVWDFGIGVGFGLLGLVLGRWL